MEGVAIRRATVSDADGILECLQTAFVPYESSYTAAAYQDTTLTLESLLRRLDEMTVIVAIDVAVDRSGCVVGTLAYKAEGEEGHLRGMAVCPACQGRNIADTLLKRAEADLAAEGCSRITLDTTEPLNRAMSFYERHGYRRSGRTQDFFGMLLVEYVKPL